MVIKMQVSDTKTICRNIYALCQKMLSLPSRPKLKVQLEISPFKPVVFLWHDLPEKWNKNYFSWMLALLYLRPPEFRRNSMWSQTVLLFLMLSKAWVMETKANDFKLLIRKIGASVDLPLSQLNPVTRLRSPSWTTESAFFYMLPLKRVPDNLILQCFSAGLLYHAYRTHSYKLKTHYLLYSKWSCPCFAM